MFLSLVREVLHFVLYNKPDFLYLTNVDEEETLVFEGLSSRIYLCEFLLHLLWLLGLYIISERLDAMSGRDVTPLRCFLFQL